VRGFGLLFDRISSPSPATCIPLSESMQSNFFLKPFAPGKKHLSLLQLRLPLSLTKVPSRAAAPIEHMHRPYFKKPEAENRKLK
jgi:hypothetical protein